jgi:hypothetical protein
MGCPHIVIPPSAAEASADQHPNAGKTGLAEIYSKWN